MVRRGSTPGDDLMARDEPWPVILLPGAILPAELAYPALLAELEADVDARAKDLEMYAGATIPPPGYSLETEVEGVRRAADEAGFETFHLVGYSGGGAAAIAFAADDPDRLRSLALMEPAWAGRRGQTPRRSGRLRSVVADSGVAAGRDHARLRPAPARGRRRAATTSARPATAVDGGAARQHRGLHPGVPRLRARLGCTSTVRSARLLRPRGLSKQDRFGRVADRLAGVFPDFTLDVFADRHHFDPPHRIEPARLAAALRGIWTRADSIRGGAARPG